MFNKLVKKEIFMSKNIESNYKRLVREAKQRLMTSGYDEIIKIRSIRSSSRSFRIANKTLSQREIYECYLKVGEILADDSNKLSAIGRLVDVERYNSMTPAEQERYIFALSTLYRALKSEYEENATNSSKI